MGDIVIRGMEMPKTCRRCIEMKIPVQCRVIKQEPVSAIMTGYNRPKDCPIKGEIPDKHGNLKDTDVVIEKLTDKIYDPNISLVEPSELIEQMIEIIKNAPTILEASK